MAKTSVVGKRPLAFTDVKGMQLSVPLSALVFDGLNPTLGSDWVAAFNLKPSDVDVVNAMAAERYSAGELTRPPAVPVVQAVVFQAAAPGVEGNNASVTLEPPTGTPPLSATAFTIQATQTDTYAGLASASAAERAIGVDVDPAPGTTDPKKGTGMVMVKAGTAVKTLTLPANQKLTVAGPADVLDTAGTTTLFKLVSRGGSAKPVDVEIATDLVDKTFTVTASYGSKKHVVDLMGGDQLPPAVTFLVTAKPPATGYAIPDTGTSVLVVPLTGGSSTSAASGTAYTSASA